MFRPFPALALPLGLFALLFAACSEEHGHGEHEHTGGHLEYCDLPVVCQEIITACHSKDDVGNAEVHECHETGHDVGTEAACQAVHDDCIATCNAAPALEGGTGETFHCGDGG